MKGRIMNYELKSGLAAALCFCFLNCSFLLLPCALRAQAPRPPIQNLSGLTGDVNITTPLDLQPLRYDTATSKWINSVTLGDIVIYSSNAGLLTNVADFYNATLMNKTGVAIDWSNIAGTEFPLPLIDGSAAKSIDVNARKLYKPDGTTVLFDWSGTNPKFPTLTNSATNAFLTTDALGNVSVAPVPNAGTIPATTTCSPAMAQGMRSTPERMQEIPRWSNSIRQGCLSDRMATTRHTYRSITQTEYTATPPPKSKSTGQAHYFLRH
jgi:hypothetical protein